MTFRETGTHGNNVSFNYTAKEDSVTDDQPQEIDNQRAVEAQGYPEQPAGIDPARAAEAEASRHDEPAEEDTAEEAVPTDENELEEEEPEPEGPGA